jgi:Immunoglobulin-like domain of bacterial spore germination/Sporulation and spore germination
MTHPTNDEQLRSLMHDAVSDVEPASGLETISARTARRRTRGSTARWLPLTVAAATAVALVIGGTVWISRETSQTNQATGPSGPGHTAVDAGPADRDLNVPVLYVGATAAGPRLFTEYHEIRGTTDTPLQAAVSEALTGRPEDPDYRNDLRALGVTARATEDDDAILIDLSDQLVRPAGMGEQTAQMVLQSLVWTADQAGSTTKPVRFTVDGQPATQELGLATSAPVAQASPDSVMATVSIDYPVQDAVLPSLFEVRGRAATFEANVVWELKQGDHVVRHGFTTATQCCTLSPYSFTVSAPTAGHYTLVVHDTNESNGEGVGTSEDTKDITVQ